MILEIKSTSDLSTLEDALRDVVGAERFDVSLLRSRPYIQFRQVILRCLASDNPSLPEAVYFSNENVVLRIIYGGPCPTVWCGTKEISV